MQLKRLCSVASPRENHSAASHRPFDSSSSFQLEISAIHKELIIGCLGVTLTRLESTDLPKVAYKPLIFVEAGGVWKVFPWATQSDLKALADQRTPEERIHLQLFHKWANLMEGLLEKEAEQPADGAPTEAPQSLR